MRNEPGVQQHDLAADSRKYMVHLEIVEARFHRELVAQQLPQRRDVPLAVAEGEQHLTDRIVPLDAEDAKERAVRLRDPKLRIQHEQRFANRVDDIQQQLLGHRDVVLAGAGCCR